MLERIVDRRLGLCFLGFRCHSGIEGGLIICFGFWLLLGNGFGRSLGSKGVQLGDTPGKQPPQQAVHILRAGLGLNGQAPHQRLFPFSGKTDTALRGRNQLIHFQALSRVGRYPTGEAVINGGAQGVNVGVGTLASGQVLLHRREAMFQLDGDGFAVFQMTGTAEIQQLHGTIGHPHDVVGADVPVDDIGVVKLLQVLQQPGQAGNQLLGVDGAGLLHHTVKRRAVQIFHGDVCRTIDLKVVQNLHHRVHGRQGCQHFGLPQEVTLAAGEDSLHAGSRSYLNTGALGALDGEIFLDGDPHLSAQIHGHIGDAETALSFDGADLIGTERTVRKNGAGRQLMGLGLISQRTSAVGAEVSGVGLVHTMWAKCHIRCLLAG